MKIEESLTKENFWNEIEQKYPNAFKVFSDWITEYFTSLEHDIFYYDKEDNDYYSITFRYLPHAMQHGICLAFIELYIIGEIDFNMMILFDIKYNIEYTFEKIEKTNNV